MSENIRGITFAEQTVTPADDAIIRRAILGDGILTGCDVTYSGSTLTMAAGYIIACGRAFQVTAAQNWAVVDATSGFARLLLTLDLTKTATEDTFKQIEFSLEYAAAEDGFLDLVQEDINLSGAKYQIVAAVVSLGTGGITGIVSKLERTEGGGGLNFKVVAGLTQPGSATENTIWVKTEKMTGWFFDVTQPENLAEGMVWFHEGASNVFAINALKKNGIQLYPMGAKQMLNGVLVEKTAMIYQSGKWNDLYVPAVVYDYGYENLDVLGGNGFRLRKGGSGYVEKYDNYFTVMSTGLSSVAMATHDDAINVSNATVLNAIVENREPNTGRFSYYGIGVIYPDAEDLGTDAFISSSKVSKEGEQTLTIDLRDVSGEVKIAVTALDYYMPVYKIWFE